MSNNHVNPIFKNILDKWLRETNSKPKVKIHKVRDKYEHGEVIYYTVDFMENQVEDSRWLTIEDAVNYCRKANYEVIYEI